MNQNYLKCFALTTSLALCAAILVGCGGGGGSGMMKPAVAKLVADAKKLTEAGDTAKARCRLDSALVLSPDSYEVAYNLGVVSSQDLHYKEAIEAYTKALKLKENSSDALYGLALSYEGLGQDFSSKVDAKSVPKFRKNANEAFVLCLETTETFFLNSLPEDPGREDIIRVKDECKEGLELLNAKS